MDYSAERTVRWTTRPDISPLRYPGGKRKLAPFVAELMAAAGCAGGFLVEPFAGGASVSLSLLESGHAFEIGLSDLDPILYAFWSTVFSPEATELAEMAAGAKLDLDEWKRQKALEPSCRLEAAYKCLYLSRTSFSGSIMAYAGPQGGKSQAGRDVIGSRFNREAVAARILELSALRERVRFVSGESWERVVANVAKAPPRGLFWYLDPPYFSKASRLYTCAFEAPEHERLAAAVDALPGSWLLSYDDHPEANRLYGGHPGFARVRSIYNARVDRGQKKVHEVVVSDVIAAVRRNAPASCPAVLALPARSRNAEAGVAVYSA